MNNRAKKVNLLYVITKLELGGAQKQLLNLINYLDKRRYSLFLITARHGLLFKSVLSLSDVKVVRSRYLERSINPLKDFLALCQIYGFIKRNKIDIVHTHSSKAGILGRWAAKFAGVKIIIHTVHGWSFNCSQNYLWRRIICYLERLTVLVTNKLIVVSYHDWQKGLINHIGKKNRDKYKLIRYGIDYKEFAFVDKDARCGRIDYQGKFRKKIGVSSSDLLVGMVSCFKPQKSPQDFIKLAFLVKESLSESGPKKNTGILAENNNISNRVKFILVGDGILRRKIERLIFELNLGESVILTGWSGNVSQILSEMNILVLTSLWEGLPISVLEAMAASLPVVATNTGGIAEVIFDGETGFLVFPGDVNRMAEKLGVLLKDRTLREEIGRGARDFLGCDFTLENMVKNTDDFYQKLINEA